MRIYATLHCTESFTKKTEIDSRYNYNLVINLELYVGSHDLIRIQSIKIVSVQTNHKTVLISTSSSSKIKTAIKTGMFRNNN